MASKPPNIAGSFQVMKCSRYVPPLLPIISHLIPDPSGKIPGKEPSGMNARPRTQASPSASMPRFDASFIEEHGLIERYLQNKLPVKGARELENWCRANPEFLSALKLAERAQSSLRLLEASGTPLDLSEPKPPWWKSAYLAPALGLVAVVCAVAFWSLFGKYELLRGELDDTRVKMHQGPLVQPATENHMRLAPDRAAGIDRAKIAVNSAAPQLIDLRIDMSYVKATQFRVVVDKKDQGRALILDNVLKDSNGELRLTFNTSGLSIGSYTARIEAFPLHGSLLPTPEGWLALEVR